jgi:hypothetical protein
MNLIEAVGSKALQIRNIAFYVALEKGGQKA